MNLVFGLPEPVVFATAGVWALLVIASLIVWGLRLRGPAAAITSSSSAPSPGGG